MNRALPPSVLAAAGAALGLALAIPAMSPAAAQGEPRWRWPETMRNPQVLPRDIGAQRLRATMMGFVEALDVRCTHCHAGTEEMDLADRDFASDSNPNKAIAREMMRMASRLNGELLPAISGLSAPRVTCYTCHRGATEPATAPPPEAS